MAILSFVEWLNRKVISDAVLPKETMEYPFDRKIPNDVDEAMAMAKDRYMKFENILYMANKAGALNKGKVIVDLKTRESIERKIKQKKKKISDIGDILRGTITTPDQETAERVAEWLFSKAKPTKYEFKEKAIDKTGYRGSYHIDINVDGMSCEVQVMPLNLFNVKDVLHATYANFRGTGKEVPPEQARILQHAVRKALMPKELRRTDKKTKPWRYDSGKY